MLEVRHRFGACEAGPAGLAIFMVVAVSRPIIIREMLEPVQQ